MKEEIMVHQPQPLQHPGSATAPASRAYQHSTQRVIKLRMATPSWQRSFSITVFVLLASIDNTILTMLPSALPLLGSDLAVSEAALGLAIGAQLLVMALTAVGWGYLSDRIDRRTVLMIGTLAWALPIGLLTRATNYPQFVILLALAGVGLGCVMTAGYSIMTDFVGPQRRGLLLSLWGGVQSLGAGVGPLLIGLFAPTHGWRVPFMLVAAIGVGLAGCAWLAVAPPKGNADPELGALPDDGASYSYQIQRADLRMLLRSASNRWLMLQGVIGQLAYGALQWLPALLTAKLLAQGVPLATAAAIGALLFPITQIGGVFGILGGYLGDRLQRRDLRARALLAGSGLWLSVPAYLVFFWLPPGSIADRACASRTGA
jgi:MFS family permease